MRYLDEDQSLPYFLWPCCLRNNWLSFSSNWRKVLIKMVSEYFWIYNNSRFYPELVSNVAYVFLRPLFIYRLPNIFTLIFSFLNDFQNWVSSQLFQFSIIELFKIYSKVFILLSATENILLMCCEILCFQKPYLFIINLFFGTRDL